MPSSLLTAPIALDEPRHHQHHHHHRPHLAAVIRRVALSLLIACAVPAAVFFVTFRVSGVWTAIVAALLWSYGAIAWRALAGRRTSGLLVLTAAVMTGRTLIALLTDSTFLYFLQPIITDGLIATAFLLSLATTRPMVAGWPATSTRWTTSSRCAHGSSGCSAASH